MLVMNKAMKLYLSHEPDQEEDARRFAKKLETMGHTVVVAADVRPCKEKPRDQYDLEVVRKAIEACDAVVIYVKERETELEGDWMGA